jgi:hypothetical protein
LRDSVAIEKHISQFTTHSSDAVTARGEERP